MISKEEIFGVLKEKWYTQEFNATPLLISPCGDSMYEMKEFLGDEFPMWWGWFKDDYCAAGYHHESMHRIGQLLFDKVKEDPDFLAKIHKEWKDEFDTTASWAEGYDWEGLGKLSNAELISHLKRAVKTQWQTVVKGHIIEPYALSTEKIIRLMLEEHIKGKGFNHAFTVLSTPTEKSFFNKSDDMLHKISKMSGSERKEAIKEYIKKYFWIRNSYVKRVVQTEESVEAQIGALDYSPQDTGVEEEKAKLIQQHNLPPLLVRMLKSLEFVTTWQDERKSYIMIIIDYIERFLEELSRRVDVPKELLRYIMPEEVDEGLFDKTDLQHTLAERKEGMLVYRSRERKEVNTEFFEEFMEDSRKAQEQDQLFDIRGVTASLGTAVGKVKICKSMDEINNFEQGDVLVASMTRPEYLPAMKKACAIVTDEGGITCHAAIVSRELGIPCVIGTKNATKVLKDGMTVEVMANHGLVRVI